MAYIRLKKDFISTPIFYRRTFYSRDSAKWHSIPLMSTSLFPLSAAHSPLRTHRSLFWTSVLNMALQKEPMYGTRPCCLVQAITRHTCPDPHLGSWNCFTHQAHSGWVPLLVVDSPFPSHWYAEKVILRTSRGHLLRVGASLTVFIDQSK